VLLLCTLSTVLNSMDVPNECRKTPAASESVSGGGGGGGDNLMAFRSSGKSSWSVTQSEKLHVSF